MRSGAIYLLLKARGEFRFVGRGGFVGLVATLLSQVPTLALALSPLTRPGLLLLMEAAGTARLLATHEAVLVRSRWKDWKKYNPGFKDLQRKDLLTKMTDMYGKPIDPAGKVYMGVRIAEEGEDISGNFIESI